MPALNDVAMRLNYSSLESWDEVYTWYKDLAKERYLADHAIQSVVEQLTADIPKTEDKIRAIYNFVASKIRYVGIELGQSAYQPSPASDVMKNLYGDCKDKVNLMRSLLAAVGIESFPVVIFSGNRRYVQPDWPSPRQFNHVIIAVKFSGELKAPAMASTGRLGQFLLFDPTDRYTPLGYLPDHQQDSLALPVKSSGSELLRAPASTPQANLLKRHVTMSLAHDGSIGCQIRERFEGSSASRNRRLHGTLAGRDYRRVIERWISRGAPGAAVSRIEAGDRDGGGFFLDVDFTAVAYGRTVGQFLLIFKPAVVPQRGLTYLNQTERKYAVVLEADSYQETVEVDLPPGFTIDEMPEPVTLTTPFAHYRADWRVEAGKLFFSRHLELDNAVVPPEDYTSVKEFFDEMIAADQAPVVLVRR